MFGDLKADCRRCRRVKNPETRQAMQRELGCHEDAPRPVWKAPCDCDGADPDCPKCDGTGTRKYLRCPGSMIAERRDVAEFATAWVQYEARNVLPVPGGWIDQAAAFTDGVVLLDRAKAHWDELKDKEREREMRMAQAARA